MNKVYSMLDIKSVDEEKRIIRGIASTITPDRMDDIVEPKGAKFSLPLPLLSQHDHHLPIGIITSAQVKSDGIEIEGEVKKDTGLEYVETAWKQIRARLVRDLSKRFRAMENEFIKESDGIHFTKWEWLELSSVTVPANAECTITSVKAFDSDPSKRLEALNAMPGVNPRIELATKRLETARRILKS